MMFNFDPNPIIMQFTLATSGCCFINSPRTDTKC